VLVLRHAMPQPRRGELRVCHQKKRGGGKRAQVGRVGGSVVAVVVAPRTSSCPAIVRRRFNRPSRANASAIRWFALAAPLSLLPCPSYKMPALFIA